MAAVKLTKDSTLKIVVDTTCTFEEDNTDLQNPKIKLVAGDFLFTCTDVKVQNPSTISDLKEAIQKGFNEGFNGGGGTNTNKTRSKRHRRKLKVAF